MRLIMKNLIITVAMGAALSVTACSEEAGGTQDQHKNIAKSPVTSAEWYKAGADVIAAKKAQAINTNTAKNVILFVGDGMGISTLTAARILQGQQRGETGEENLLSFETLPYTAIVKTYNTDMQVADSAGTASAMNTGVKTRIGIISEGPEQTRGQCLGAKDNLSTTLAERMEEAGYATGIVSTARLTHATPAAVYAHSPDRSWENDSELPEEAVKNGCKDIAAQLIEFSAGDGLEVALGGGRANFLPKPDGGKRTDGRNLTQEWTSSDAKARYVDDLEGLKAATPENTSRLLGLFNDSHMKFEVDRSESEPSLAEMTEKAISFLRGKGKGYYLMVEAGRVDHAHHGSNARRALQDTIALSDAVEKALEMIDLSDTMVLVTADHSHVFTMAGYSERGNPILGVVKAKGETVKGEDGKPYTSLGYGNGPGYIEGPRPDLTNAVTMDKNYRQLSTVPLKSETHGGEDVALFAVGPWAHLVRGTIEQNVVYHYMLNALGLNDEEKVE